MHKVTWVECGRIGRAVGLRGEVAVFWNSGRHPFKVGEEVFLGVDGKMKDEPNRIAALRVQGRSFFVRFEGIEDKDAARALTGVFVYVPEDRLPQLEEDEYYSYQILGMRVITENGRELGKIVKIFAAGENDVYEILPDGGQCGDEILVPAIKSVVISVDIENKIMTVRPLDGMML